MKRLIKNGAIVRERPKGGKVSISIPQIDIPHFAFGDTGEGLGRGQGKRGDVIGRDPGKGKGGGGDAQGEGITIQIDLEDLLDIMEEDLKLPKMKPKPNETFEEIKIKYNDISKNGPESLRHTRRTMKEAIKRLAMTGELNNLQMVPSSKVPIRLITPINSDRRYRQYTEIKIPSSNAVIFFARDCSASMDDFRCDIVSDMAWWINCWIKKFYKRVDRCYFVHDTHAEEVDEQKFYSYRFGGGTACSSAFDAIAQQLENRYPPDKFNVYIFYFTDGDNQYGDNEKMVKILQEKLTPNLVNMIGIAQICAWNYNESVKHYIDVKLDNDELDANQIRTVYVGQDESSKAVSWGYVPDLTEEERNEQIIKAIRNLLTEKETEV